MTSNLKKIILTIIVYLYLLMGYLYIIYNLSYHIRITDKLEGWAVLIVVSLMYFLAYVVINHILTKLIIPTRILIVIEVLLLLTMIILVISDAMYEEFLHQQYIKRHNPVLVD